MQISVSNFNPYTTFGLGLFETMAYINGTLPFLEEHLERLQAGMLYLNTPLRSLPDPQTVLDQVKAISKEKKCIVRLVARLDSTLELHVSEDFPYTVTDYRRGFSLVVTTTRKNQYSPYVSIKTLNNLDNHLERNKAKEAGFNDALFLNTKKKVAETASANIFILRTNTIITPPVNAGILPGIIRARVIAFAEYKGFQVLQKNIELHDLSEAEHIFLTNSLLCSMPVSSINNQIIKRDMDFEENFCKAFMKTSGYL